MCESVAQFLATRNLYPGCEVDEKDDAKEEPEEGSRQCRIKLLAQSVEARALKVDK